MSGVGARGEATHTHMYTLHVGDGLAISSSHVPMSKDSKTDAPALKRSTYFYTQMASGASVLAFRRHPGASVSRNVGLEGHPFSQNGHPLNSKRYF